MSTSNVCLPLGMGLGTKPPGGGVLGISSYGDDRMEPKVKTQKKSLGLPAKPKKIPGPKMQTIV